MALLRVTDPDLAVIQRRAFCHFTDEQQRTQQMPDPEVGCVSVIGTVFEFWNGSDWLPFP